MPRWNSKTLLLSAIHSRKPGGGGNDTEFAHTGVRVSSKDEAVVVVFRGARHSQINPTLICAGFSTDFT